MRQDPGRNRAAIRTRLFTTILAALALLLASLPTATAPVARAEGARQGGPWYRYQGEPSSFDNYNNQGVNCGPASVAMAVQYARGLPVPVREIRAFIGKHRDGTNYADLSRALSHWGVQHRTGIHNVQGIYEAIGRGNVVVLSLRMGLISPGVDYRGRSADPAHRVGRYNAYAGGHWIVVKGVTSDGRYLIVNDGNVWGGPGTSTYWYSDGTPKGMDRLYAAAEVERAMDHRGANTQVGLEVLREGGGQADQGAPPPSVSGAPDARIDQILAGTRMRGMGRLIAQQSAERGVPAELALAMFRKESSFGASAVAVKSNNPAGIKYFGQKTSTGSSPSGFAMFPTLEDGVREWFRMMGNPDGRYKPLIERGDYDTLVNIYAPPFENDTRQYIRDIEAWMAQYRRYIGEGVAAPAPSGYDAALRALVPAGRVVRPWRPESAEDPRPGVEIEAPAGSPVYTLERGVITEIGEGETRGVYVAMRDDRGRTHLFAHLSDANPNLEEGEDVGRGEAVGRVGSTGAGEGFPPHLHYRLAPRGEEWANPAAGLANWNVAAGAPAAIALPVLPSPGPASAALRIAGGETARSRYVTLELSAEGASGMMLSNSEYFMDGFEEPYADKKLWALEPGDGPRRVWARFKSPDGEWSEPVSAQVNLDEQPPIGALTVAPDPRIIASAPLTGHALPAVGQQTGLEGAPRYGPLGRNLLVNPSFEAWAGGIPAGWESQLHKLADPMYNASQEARHGRLSLYSLSAQVGAELEQRVSLKPATRYTLSALLKGSEGAISVEEQETQEGKSVSLRTHAPALPPGAGWREVRLTFDTDPRTTDAVIALRGKPMLWDSLSLTEGARPGLYRQEGLVVEGPTANHIPNSSAELDAGGWSGINARVDLESSRDYARYGGHSLLVRKQTNGTASTFAAARLRPGATYTYSVFARLDSGGPITSALLRGWMYEGAEQPSEVDLTTMTEANRPPMRWAPAGGGWWRGRYTFIATKDKGLYGVLSSEQLGLDTVYYLDGAQLEPGAFPSSYADGGLGPGYAWTGQPYASPSTREGVRLAYGKTEGAQGAVHFWARPQGWAVDSPLLSVGDVQLRVRGGQLQLLKGERPLAAAAWRGGDARAYAVVWADGEIALFQDGRFAGKGTATPPAEGSELRIGPGKDALGPNAMVGDVSLWRQALGATELAELAKSGALAPGRDRVNTSLVRVATGATDITEGEIRTEWSTDGKVWRSWDEPDGERPWDFGPTEGPKQVWVRYTDEAGNSSVYSEQVILDRTAPRLVNAGAAPGGVVTLRFSEPVQAGTLDNLAVTAAGLAVPGRWEYTEGALIARFVPAQPPQAPVQLSMGKGVLDLAGNGLTTR